MENLEEKSGGKKKVEGRRTFLKWFGVGAIAAILGLGSGCKAVEERDYQREGRYNGVDVTSIAREKEPRKTKWNYEIYKKNGRTYYKGDVFNCGDKRYYHGEIFLPEVIKEQRAYPKPYGRTTTILKLKDGKFYTCYKGMMIGQKPNGDIIEITPLGESPIEVSKEWREQEEGRKKGKKSEMDLWLQGIFEH